MASTISPFNQSLQASASGMAAQSKRLQIITENIANAESKAAAPGGQPYRRKTIALGAAKDMQTGLSTVKVKKIGTDPTAFKEVYAPQDPMADERGYVQMPNVNPMVEMVDMQEARLSHEANVEAYKKSLKMIEDTIGILRN
ncbi:flagellar basal body rod protein FlgC [Candidatus Odyssella acanthamoebae]|uniref:Flagellar basal-body rod protein FlgC n=1 Tax=Candidatus Odyssella acanthamoebae TaxID=91604 RepID=A0A077AYV1_9PROT|nr:flagellar basal body rod protein FlgC [Candidatus Paracaedibacter acanthamoebae]AIK96813.1 flagellar basal body rod protein FlgC [Candidatus Paracaedibacter acanthamoebae]